MALVRLFVEHYAWIAFVAVLPAATFAALTADFGWWTTLRAWWQPWSDATLFAVLTTIVHEGLYFGERGFGLRTDATDLCSDLKAAPCLSLRRFFHLDARGGLCCGWGDLTRPFAGVNGFYLLCDSMGYLQHFKLPRTPTQVVSPQLLRSTLRDAIIGGVFLQVPGAMLLYGGMQRFGSDMGGPVPPFWTVYQQVRRTGKGVAPSIVD
jgi:hypothetical protein